MAAQLLVLDAQTARIRCQCGYLYEVTIRNGMAGSDFDFCPECDRPTGINRG